MITLLVLVAVFGAGLGLGRVKNKAKLVAVQTEINKIKAESLVLEADAAVKLHAVVARIESKL